MGGRGGGEVDGSEWAVPVPGARVAAPQLTSVAVRGLHMRFASEHRGSWTGSNGFRLMPTDSFSVAPATAEVSAAAGGNLVVITYAWAHSDDGAQEGLLVIGPPDEAGGVVAFWGDSWHQHPQPQVLTGAIEGAEVHLSYVYAAEWQWRITCDATEPGALRLRMANVVPESGATDDLAAGGYLAMDAELHRRP